MTQRDPAKQLAKELADLRKEVRSGSRASQMRFRSLEGGAIPVYDANGNPTGSIGLLPDGTTGFDVIDGPKPVAPSAPIVFPLIGGLEVGWDGKTFDGSPLPGDYRLVEVHAAPYGAYDPDASTLRTTLVRPGSVILPLPAGDAWTVYFVIRTTAGKLSDPSVGATETPEHQPTEAELTDARNAAQAAETAAQSAEDKALEAVGIAADKGKVYYGITPPAADPNGLWIDQGGGRNTPKRHDGTDWVAVTDKAATDAADAAADAQAVADAALLEAQAASQKANDALLEAEAATLSANGKNRVFWRDANNPPPSPLITGDIWFVQDQDNKPRIYRNGAWADATFADGAISFLNVSKLTTGQLNVGQRIIAGLITGTHAEMSDTGFRVFADDINGDGVPDEVVRMGTQSNDFFGIVGANGQLLASVDDTGRGNFAALTTESLTVAGKSVTQLLSNGPRGEVAHFKGSPGFDLAPIFAPVGIAEVGFPVYRGRSYLFKWSMHIFANAGVQTQVNARWTQGVEGDTVAQAPAPQTNSATFAEWRHLPVGDNQVQIISGEALFVPAFTSRVRMGITLQTGGDGAYGFVGAKNRTVEINVTDVGLHVGNIGQFSNFGGSLHNTATPPPPPSVAQQYYRELAPAGRMSWRGDGAHMNWVGGDVYQGYQSANGNTRGQFWFDLPNITGNVDRVDLWVYFRHWHFNSGGTMRLALTDQRGVFTDHAFGNDYRDFGGYPKPGGREVMLPPEWWPLFRGTNNNSLNGRATVIRLGPGIGTNQLYYGVATDARLRIYYTQ